MYDDVVANVATLDNLVDALPAERDVDRGQLKDTLKELERENERAGEELERAVALAGVAQEAVRGVSRAAFEAAVPPRGAPCQATMGATKVIALAMLAVVLCVQGVESGSVGHPEAAEAATGTPAALATWLAGAGAGKYAAELADMGVLNELDLRFVESGDLVELGMTELDASNFLIRVRDTLPALPVDSFALDGDDGDDGGDDNDSQIGSLLGKLSGSERGQLLDMTMKEAIEKMKSKGGSESNKSDKVVAMEAQLAAMGEQGLNMDTLTMGDMISLVNETSRKDTVAMLVSTGKLDRTAIQGARRAQQVNQAIQQGQQWQQGQQGSDKMKEINFETLLAEYTKKQEGGKSAGSECWRGVRGGG